jgi:hypothetical protein
MFTMVDNNKVAISVLAMNEATVIPGTHPDSSSTGPRKITISFHTTITQKLRYIRNKERETIVLALLREHSFRFILSSDDRWPKY